MGFVYRSFRLQSMTLESIDLHFLLVFYPSSQKFFPPWGVKNFCESDPKSKHGTTYEILSWIIPIIYTSVHFMMDFTPTFRHQFFTPLQKFFTPLILFVKSFSIFYTMTNLETGTFNKLFDGISDDMEISWLMTFLSPN